MMRRLCITLLVFIAFAWGQLSVAISQDLVITMTDKEGVPRANRQVVYNITGINVDVLGQDLPLLKGIPASSRTVTSDATGEIRIPMPKAKLADATTKKVLHSSKRITVHCYPQAKPGAPELANFDVELLLGDQPHNVKLVVMTPRYFYEQRTIDKYAYASRRGNFHLVGDLATALYIDPRTNRLKLSKLSLYKHDKKFFYYRDVHGRNKYWAFSKYTLWVSVRKGCVCRRQLRIRVWLYDADEGAEWRQFTLARAIRLASPIDVETVRRSQ